MMNATQLKHTAQVLADMLTFKQPADAVLSDYFRQHRKLGRQDRHEIAETAFAALRHYQKIAAVLRRPYAQPEKAALAALVLGRGTNLSQLTHLADEETVEFLSRLKARKTEWQSSLHTAAELPEWLVERLQAHWTDEQVLAFGHSVMQPAPLDTRVNTLKGRRDKVLAELQAEFPHAFATPYAPHGIRFRDKPALNKHPLFLDGTLEVQDEGSQLLAQLVQAKRGEIVVDFCAGAGGKTAGEPEAAHDPCRADQYPPRKNRQRTRPARDPAGKQSRPRAGGRALFRSGHAAAQSRFEIPPVARKHCTTGAATAQYFAGCFCAGGARRTFGVCDMQRAARRERAAD